MHNMHIIRFVPALAAIAVALPQQIDLDLAYALPNPSYSTAKYASAQIVTYNPTSVIAAAMSQITSSPAPSDLTLSKRQATACSALPTGVSGYSFSPDSPAAFTANPSFASAASAAPTPSGYISSFTNLGASNK